MSQGIIETVGGAAFIAAGVLVEIGTLGGGTPLAAFLISAGAGMVMNGVGTMLAQGPVQGFATAARNPTASWEVVYGRKRVGGTIVFINSFGDNDKYLDLVMLLAAHPSQSVDALLFDQQRIQMVTTGPGKTSVSPIQQNVVIADIARVGNVVTCKTVGDIPTLQSGDTVIVQQVPGDLTLNGKYPVANVAHGPGYVQFTYLCGGPASHVVSAGHVLTTWVDFGTKVYMETLLGSQTLGTTFSAMSTGTPNDGNIFDLVHNTANPWSANCSLVGMTAVWLRLHYNDKIFANGLPQISFLMHGKNDIYDPRTSPPSSGYTENAALCIADYLCHKTWGFKQDYGVGVPLAPLIAAANICDESVALAWPVTSPVTTEPRYALNGGFAVSMKRGDVLRNMLTACAGRITYYGGEYRLWPGAWYGVSGSVTGSGLLSMATAGFTWRPNASLQNRYNGVKGTFISPANNWQSSDFPRYAQDATHGYTWGVGPTHDANLDADSGDRRWYDLQLPFTISAATAQRIAKIYLLRQLFAGTGTFALNMSGYQFTPMDVIEMDLAYFGWTAKQLEVGDTRLKFDPQEGGGMLLGVEIDVQETDASIYTWTTGEELSPQGYRQANVPDTRTPAPPTDVFASSIDGTITITWVAPADSYVLNGGHIEAQYQLVASPEGLWDSMAQMEPTITQVDIRGLRGGDQYNVRVRSVNAAGVPSDWIYASPVGSSPATPGPITVIGLATAEPLLLSFPGTPGQVAVPYAVGIVVSGGVGPYLFAITSGALPSVLALDASTGIISGVPDTPGLFPFDITVTDSTLVTTGPLPCAINIVQQSGTSVLLPVATAVGRDVGHGSDVEAPLTRLVSFQVGAVATFASAPDQYNTVLLAKDGGSNWLGVDWYLWTTSGAEIFFAEVRPVSAETWKIAIAPGAIEFDAVNTIPTASLPAGTVLSSAFAVAGLALPTTGLVSSLTLDAGIGGSFPYDETDASGFHDWCLQSIQFDPTAARANPNVFTAILTCEDINAAGASIGEEHIYGTPQVLAQGTVQDFGMINGPYGDVATPARSAAIAGVRLRLRWGTRIDQTTEAWRNSSAVTLENLGGVGYQDVTVAVAAATPSGVVSGSRNAAANRATAVSRVAQAKLASTAPWSGIQGPVEVGGGGSAIAIQSVKDAVGNVVVWFGKKTVSGTDYYGIWGGNFWVGGTDPTNPKIWLDGSGNGHFLGAIESGSSIQVLTANGVVALSATTTGVQVDDSIHNYHSFLQGDHLSLFDGVGGTVLNAGASNLAYGKLAYDAAGKLTKYDNLTLAGKGAGHIIYRNLLTSQTGHVNFIPQYAGANLAGLFRLNVVLEIYITNPTFGGQVAINVGISRAFPTLGAGAGTFSAVLVKTVNAGDAGFAESVVVHTDGAFTFAAGFGGVEVDALPSGLVNAYYNLYVVIEKLDDVIAP